MIYHSTSPHADRIEARSALPVPLVPSVLFRGTATRRCVKLVLFFAIEKNIDVSGEEEAPSSGIDKSEEVKQEAKPEKNEGEEEVNEE